ncbi:MAG: hypothetical protein KAU20_03990 [Nanoarchaeota archaeon]|nr:hypothetical protein [Nanoarchaeota archaeon]
MGVKIRKIVLIILVLFLLVVFLSPAKAQSYSCEYKIPDYNEIPELNRGIVNEFDSDVIYYQLNPDDIYINETGNYSEIIVEDFYYSSNIGEPILPFKYFEIPIPEDMKVFKVKIINSSDIQIRISEKIKPFIPEEHDFLDMFPEYEIYDEFFSSHDLITVDFGYRGKQKYALLRYYPFGYDSGNNNLNVTISGMLKIEYSGEKYYAIKKGSEKKDLFLMETSPDVEWNKTFGGSSDDRAYSVQQTSDNGYIIAGYTKSSAAGDEDFWLVKTDLNGNQEWSKTFGGSSHDYAYSVQQTSDNGYIVAGATNSFGAGICDFWLVKTDLNGNQEWSKTFGGSSHDYARSIQQTNDNGYIVAGYTFSFARGSDFWLIKTDLNGNQEWSKTSGRSGYDHAYSVQQTSDNGYIVAGDTYSFAGSYDFWLIKTDVNGNQEWSKTFGGSSDDRAYSVQQTSDNGYIVAGHTKSFGAGDEDFWLIKTDLNGNQEWSKTFGGSDSDYAESVQQTSDNGYIVAGYTKSFGAGSSDFWLIKTDLNGNQEWSKTFGGSSNDYAYSIQQTSDNGYIVAGYTGSFGVDYYDFWLIKLKGSICETMLDLSVDSSDISFIKQNNNVNVSVLIKNNGESSASNVEVKFLDTHNSNLVKKTTVNISSIPASGSKTASINWELDEGHIVYVIVDPDDKIDESDESNNNVHKEYVGTLKYYVEADVPPSSSEIGNYVKNNIEDGVIVNNPDEADVKILIARHNPLIVWHFATLEDKGWGFYGGAIKFEDKVCDKPYCGVIGNTIKDGKKEIYIEANDVDGFIAASKKFIKEQDSFKTTGNAIFLDEEDEDAIAVYDYLHTDDNLPYYKKDSDEFKEIVRKSLEGEMYNEEDGNFTTTISGQNINLRYTHLDPEHNQIFLDWKNPNDDYPVVMAGGIWSDISAWEELGGELSDEGKDVWLIEITGGPDMECDTCPDYTYDDLTDNVWPAYIEGIKSISEKDKVHYIGHSNGARVALSSLNEIYTTNSPVDKFISVACPTTLNDDTIFTGLVRKKIENQFVNDTNGNYAMSKINQSGETHIKKVSYLNRLIEYGGGLISDIITITAIFEDEKISRNLLSFYNQLALEEDSTIDLSNVNLDKLYLFNTNPQDTVVGIEDQDRILDGATSINSGNKEGIVYGNKWNFIIYNHASLRTKRDVKKGIKEVLE